MSPCHAVVCRAFQTAIESCDSLTCLSCFILHCKSYFFMKFFFSCTLCGFCSMLALFWIVVMSHTHTMVLIASSGGHQFLFSVSWWWGCSLIISDQRWMRHPTPLS
jgi:hypothetical protein